MQITSVISKKNIVQLRSSNLLHFSVFWFCEKCWAQQKPVTLLVECESTSTVTVTTLSFGFSFCLCAFYMNTQHICCTYGSCVCVLAGKCVGERCLSTNISARFRYWSVRRITDSLRVTSGSPEWTDTWKEESKSLNIENFNPREYTTKKWKKAKNV